ncbi:MAG: Gfo/Idh/MocA family oxidoreductase [Armatimonadaceae bacterium]
MSNGWTRRAVLTGLTGGVATAAIAGEPRPAVLQERKLGWAIVALGSLSWGQILPGFAQCKQSKLVAVVTGTPEKGKRARERYGVPSVYNYENFDKIKDNPDIDCVYIVLPNGMHAEYTIRAANAGKHVLCEKPMANTPEECEQMIAACKKNRVKLMVAYRCQYEPHNVEAIRLAQEGKLGKLKVITSDHGFAIGDPSQWRCNKKLAGGGSLMDIGIYSLQAARYLTGEEPVAVSAQEFSTPNDPRFKEVEENINFVLRFPSGVLANCSSSYGYTYQNRIRAVGETGWVDLEPATAYGGISMRTFLDSKFQERKMPDGNHFAREMDHLSECVLKDKTPKTPGEEGLADLRVMMAIYEAARTGKTVSLPTKVDTLS